MVNEKDLTAAVEKAMRVQYGKATKLTQQGDGRAAANARGRAEGLEAVLAALRGEGFVPLNILQDEGYSK